MAVIDKSCGLDKWGCQINNFPINIVNFPLVTKISSEPHWKGHLSIGLPSEPSLMLELQHQHFIVYFIDNLSPRC
ncbi:hypothetical protein SUGI_0053380 [Cryptomeria japonica]|nr:hypothetical protein SUGI_0053380 [Cryptomeria japonica]